MIAYEYNMVQIIQPALKLLFLGLTMKRLIQLETHNFGIYGQVRMTQNVTLCWLKKTKVTPIINLPHIKLHMTFYHVPTRLRTNVHVHVCIQVFVTT